MTRECPRMTDVAAAIARGAGLHVGGAGLRAADGDDADIHRHVAVCPSCADLAVVMSSLRAERERARRSAQVPAAGLVWWRAQLRQRRAAARVAAAPVTVLNAVTLVLAVGLALFLAWTASRIAGVPDVSSYLPALPSWSIAPATEGGAASSLTRYALALGAAAWIVLAPVALYFALRRD
jgi:hypothetical protein